MVFSINIKLTEDRHDDLTGTQISCSVSS